MPTLDKWSYGAMTEAFTSDDPAQRLRDACAELRTLPLGGRGYLADACIDGAAEIARLRVAAEEAIRALEAVPGERVAAQLLEVRIALQAALNNPTDAWR